jgi:asparagine synthase (glutamine-hydrolysing)
MCSIMGVKGNALTPEEFSEYLKRTSSRGPDAMKTVELDGGLLGFCRLAIMGLHEAGMQPFYLNGNFVSCNGELYGFRPLKAELEKEYVFKSDSDCELLLPLYEKHGLEMFKKLDAEFALIIWDGKKRDFIAARDPISSNMS